MHPHLLNLGAALLLSAAVLPAAGTDRVFNVRDYGAKGDRGVHNRTAIQAALDACAKAGGGTVRLPPGDYLSGSLRMASGVTLRLEAGATLWASTNRSDYSGGGERHLLVADGVHHVALTGQGIINGQGAADYGARWSAPEKPEFRTGILLFTGCRDVTVRGVTILNSDAWTLHFKRCEDVAVEDVTIRNNYRRLNSDGIDPNSCRRVRIARCRISAGDDCIVLKSTEAHPCEDVAVTDCFLESAASALKLGTESHGDFRNIRFANCVITNSPTGIGFYLKDGATIERVAFSNIVIGPCSATNRTVTPVFMDIERRHPNSRVGRIRDVIFERLDITTGSGILVQGMAESPIERLTFRDVRIRVPQADSYARRSKPVGGTRTTQDAPDARNTEFARLPAYFTVAHARDLRVEAVRVEIAESAFRSFDRAAFCGRHIERGTLLDVRRRPGPEAGILPVIDLEGCRGFSVAGP
ncbi:MAG TPA: glycoside hydrolase family 28 protein [Candidatus Paceibacterota bacterium]|nr:glycoside hydrolase family 28 protein [Verrucomicrobiota bacterium]HRZ46846.1 glycoside hydrolase family 28 protein [Candidatus Paceibacterota bacterium]HRZ57043.1 glycoside hydrolase family 28 protein [Candidatus Paceibacterota bacterium]